MKITISKHSCKFRIYIHTDETLYLDVIDVIFHVFSAVRYSLHTEIDCDAYSQNSSKLLVVLISLALRLLIPVAAHWSVSAVSVPGLGAPGASVAI